MNTPNEFRGKVGELVDYIEKGGPGSGRKNLLNNIDKGEELARNMIKIKKARGYIAVHKAVMLVQGYSPMEEDDLKKSFDGRDIPEIMKKEENRPPKEWFDSCMIKSRDAGENDPATFCCNMWKGEEKPGVCDRTQAGKKKRWQELSEAFNKASENIDKCEGCEEITKAVEEAIAKALSEYPDIVKVAPALASLIPVAAGVVGAAAEPIASKVGEKVGDKIVGKSETVTQKAVAERANDGTKVITGKREPIDDEGGESQVSGDPTKGSVKDLKPSKTQKEEKIDIP